MTRITTHVSVSRYIQVVQFQLNIILSELFSRTTYSKPYFASNFPKIQFTFQSKNKLEIFISVTMAVNLAF